MATLEQTLRINDIMTRPLRNITASMNILISNFERLQRVSANPIDVAGMQTAREHIAKANVQLDQVEQSIKQSNQAQQGFNRSLRSGADAAGALWNKIGGIAAAIGGLSAIKGLINLSDQQTMINARLNLIVDDGGSLSDLQNKIMASAQRSRASYSDTADIISKIGLRAADSFKNNDEIIRFSETLNKMYTIAGASQEEMRSANLQLVQALGSGILRGEEFNAVFEAAPNVMQAVAEYMQQPIGALKDLAANGQISADIVKNALFAAAEETDEKFSQMPMTWSQMWTTITNTALQAFGPVIDAIGRGAQFIYDNWSTIEPIFWGIVGAVGALSIAFGIWKIYTWAQTAALYGLSAALTATGIGAIVVVIGLVIGAIAKWVQSVGGLKIAWLTVVDKVLTAWDAVKLAFVLGVNHVKNLWNTLQLAWMSTVVAIQNWAGDLKVNVLTILQNMINGAISLINQFIGLLNKIPGVNIDLVSQMTFATTAAAENDVAKKARSDDLQRYRNQILSDMEARTLDWRIMQQKAQDDHLNRLVEITVAKNEAAENYGIPSDWNSMLQNVGDTAANTARTADAMDISNEDLKYIRDLAERDIIDRTTVASITVDMGGVSNTINSPMDLDGVVTYIADYVSEGLAVAVEGVH